MVLGVGIEPTLRPLIWRLLLRVYKARAYPNISNPSLFTLFVLLSHLPVILSKAHVIPVTPGRNDTVALAVVLVLGELEPVSGAGFVRISRPAQAIGVILVLHGCSPL